MSIVSCTRALHLHTANSIRRLNHSNCYSFPFASECACDNLPFFYPFYLFLSVLGVSISVEGDAGDNEPDDAAAVAAPADAVSESPVALTPPPNSIASDVVKADLAEDEVVNSTPEAMRDDSVTVHVNEPSPVADEGHSPVRSPYTIAGFTGITLCLVGLFSVRDLGV